MCSLSAATGQRNWNYVTGGAVWSSPAVANGVVYFGSTDSKHNNKVYAIGTPQKPTSLTITAPTTARVKVDFAIMGRLTSGLAGLANQTINLQLSFDNKTWTNSTTTPTAKTNTTGWYRFTHRVPFASTVYYRTRYSGSAPYVAAVSKGVKVVVS